MTSLTSKQKLPPIFVLILMTSLKSVSFDNFDPLPSTTKNCVILRTPFPVNEHCKLFKGGVNEVTFFFKVRFSMIIVWKTVLAFNFRRTFLVFYADQSRQKHRFRTVFFIFDINTKQLPQKRFHRESGLMISMVLAWKNGSSPIYRNFNGVRFW